MADVVPTTHLEKTIAGQVEPTTHLEKVIALYGGSGGSGGTTNYNLLSNKPKVNGVELSGNKTLKQLGIDLSKYTTTDKAVSNIELVDAVPTGSTGTTTEKCLRLSFADGTTVVDVSVNDLVGSDDKLKKAIVCVIDDDGTTRTNDSYTGMTTWLNSQGIPMDFAICYDTIGTGGKLTVAQLQSLQASGNGILIHGNTRLQDFSTADEVREELEKAIKFHSDNNLENPKGIYVYPDGINDDTTLTTKEVKEIVHEYFNYGLNVNSKQFSSDITNGVWNEIPLKDNLDIARMEINDTKNLTLYKDKIDSCVTNKGLLILFTHSFRSTFATTGYDNFKEVINYLLTQDVEFLTVSNAFDKIEKLSGNYNALTNKPRINGVELTGDKTLSDLGITTYDDTQVKADIKSLQNNKVDKVTGKSLIDDTEIARLAKVDNYDDKAIKASIKTVADGLMASAGYSADYKNVEIVTVGGTKKSIDVAPIISHAKVTELSDVDGTNQGDGKALIFNSATGKHEYKDIAGTDEKVKMDSSSDAKYLGDLVDKTTIDANATGQLVAKTLDGLTASITELNYIKGLQMPVQDLVTAFANGGLKTIDTPFPTYADLQSYDVSTLLDDIRYLVRVLDDETHGGKITAYLIKKGQTAPTFYGYLSDSRDFTTNPIDLVTEVTGKLKAKNIDSDDLFALLTLNDTYKTSTAKDEIFGTHGAKAMYDELVTAIGKKADSTTLTTHTSDTDIHVSTTEKDTWNTVTDKASKSDLTSHTGDSVKHITSAERTKWNKVDNKVDKTDIVDNLTSTNTDKPLSAKQGKILKGEVDLKANKTEVVKKTDITTTIDSTSTDTQVPGALSVYNAIYDLVGLDKNNNILTIKRPSDELEGGEIHLETPITGCTLTGDIVIDTYGDYLRIFEGKGTHRGCRIDFSKMKRDVLSSVCTTNVADVPVTNIAPADTTTFINFKGNSNCNYCVKNGICYVTLWGVKIASTGGTIKPGVILPKSANNIAGALMIGAGDATEHAFAFIIGTGELCFDVKDANIPLHCTFSYPVKES